MSAHAGTVRCGLSGSNVERRTWRYASCLEVQVSAYSILPSILAVGLWDALTMAMWSSTQSPCAVVARRLR